MGRAQNIFGKWDWRGRGVQLNGGWGSGEARTNVTISSWRGEKSGSGRGRPGA